MNVMLVDDEAAARRGMRMLLERAGEVNVVSECGNGDEALEQMRRVEVDAVFLDIEMPGRNGVEVAREIGATSGAQVVFLTAYGAYAVSAFEQEVADYLLKPVSMERVRQTLDRLRRRCECHKTLSLRGGTEQYFVPAAEIRWIEAAGDYVCVYTERKTLIVAHTLNEMEQELDAMRFVRVHRSAIVRVDCVRGLRNLVNRDAIVELDRGEEVRVSRTHRGRLEGLLNGLAAHANG